MQPIFATSQFQEQACSFESAGETVKAIVTRPPQGTPVRGGIVLSHGWSGFRSGPSGILTAFAREFAVLGYVSLRFDYRGRGESEGEGLQATLTTMADDLVAAAAFLKRSEHLDRPAFCGLCSGGNVVIGTLKRLPTASRLLLLSVYPFSDGDAFGRDVHRTLHYLHLYWKKLLRPDTWSRLVRGDVSLRNVAKVIFGHFLNRGANRRRERDDAKPSAPAPSAAAPQLPQAVKAAKVESRSQEGREAPKKHLANLRPDLPGIIVYGSADPDAPAAGKYYGDYIREHHLPIDLATIDGANHNFTSPAWRRQALDLLKAHL